MENKTETPLARGAIRSKEIGYDLQKKLEIKGKILVEQIRGGKIQFSIITEDEDKLLDFFATIPSYDKTKHIRNIEHKHPYTVITAESFFRLRFLATLYLKDSELDKTMQIADLSDKLINVGAKHSNIAYLREVLKDFQWNPKLFIMLDQEALLCSHVRKLVQAHTIVCLDNERAHFKPTKAVSFDVDDKASPKSEPTGCVFEVLQKDCLLAARSLVKEGHSVCVLNMANQFTPGGGYANGAGAQEEDLCRRTDLLKSLPGHYPDKKVSFGEFSVLYSTNVTVFRGDKTEGYALYEPNNRFNINVVSSAAYNLGDKDKPSYKNPNTPEYESGMKRKIRGQLRVAGDHGNRCLVLSAFGCGAFKNDATKVSQFYLDVLSEKEFEGVFDIIQFAIVPNPSETDNKNFDNFSKTFEGKGLPKECLSVSEIVLK